MVEEISVENGRVSNFEGLVTSTLDRIILHTIIGLYLHAKFHWNRKNFLSTDKHMYVRTDGHLRPALIGRRGSDKSTYKITRESSWSPYPCTPYSARHEIVLPAKQLDLLNSLMHIMASTSVFSTKHFVSKLQEVHYNTFSSEI